MFGFTVNTESTSVKFSYISAFIEFARIAPVISEPPRENVITSPLLL